MQLSAFDDVLPSRRNRLVPADISCVASDFRHHANFSKSVEGFGRAGDILVGLLTMGIRQT
jgi:phosphoheptose isomerase